MPSVALPTLGSKDVIRELQKEALKSGAVEMYDEAEEDGDDAIPDEKATISSKSRVGSTKTSKETPFQGKNAGDVSYADYLKAQQIGSKVEGDEVQNTKRMTFA